MLCSMICCLANCTLLEDAIQYDLLSGQLYTARGQYDLLLVDAIQYDLLSGQLYTARGCYTV